MTNETDITNKFNKFFTNNSPELARRILTELNKIDTTMPADSNIFSELKEIFFSLKITKNPGYDEINSNDYVSLSCHISV